MVAENVRVCIQQEKVDLSFKLKMQKQKDVLYVKVEGDRNFKTLVTIAERIIEACRENNTCRALIDVRAMEGGLSTWETFRLVTSCFSRLRNWHVLRKAAIVDREEKRPRYTFLETVADNRGYNLRVFEDTAEADNWLTS